MEAWDGWAGALVGSLIGSAVGLGTALQVMYSTRRADRSDQEKLLHEQKGFALHEAASTEVANLCRAITMMAVMASKPRQHLAIGLQRSLALASAFRIGELLQDDGRDFAILLVDGIEALWQRGEVLTRGAWFRPIKSAAETGEFAASLVTCATRWLERPERREEVMKLLHVLLSGESILDQVRCLEQGRIVGQ